MCLSSLTFSNVFSSSGEVTDDGRYLIVNRGAEPKNHLYYYDLSSGGVNSSIPLTTIIDKFEASYDVTAMMSF